MVEENGCPIERVISFLGNKWTLLIIKILEENKKLRFNEISNTLTHISPRTLSKRLKELEKEGFVSKQKFNELPPKVEYSLTKKGKEFGEYFHKLNKMILKWEN